MLVSGATNPGHIGVRVPPDISESAVISYYKLGHTIEECMSKFSIGFQKAKQIIAPHQRKRGDAAVAHLSLAIIRQGFLDHLTLDELSTNLNVTKPQLQKWILHHGFQYNITSLFGDDIVRMYVTDNLTMSQIANQFGVTYSNIRQILTKLQISKPKTQRTKSLVQQTRQQHGVDYLSQTPKMRKISKQPKSYNTKQITKDLLMRLYVDEQQSLKQIGKTVGVTDLTIKYYCDKFNIPTTTKDDYVNASIQKGKQHFVEQATALYGETYTYGEYRGAGQPLDIYCTIHNQHFTQLPHNHLRCTGCSGCRITKSSKSEREILLFIRSELNINNVIENSRSIISPYELDIFLPEYNIAIEFNGLYWHSEIHDRITPDYHLNKTQMCEEQGIRLIHIFEDEWRDQQQKCKDTIRHLLGKSVKGVYARQTYIKEIPWKTAKDFLNQYHLLNAGSSGNYRIGAFDKKTDELIGVMVFGRSSSERTNEIELKRFVTNKKNNPGLGSKMFKYAVKSKEYQEVIAFVDRRWFTGLVKSYIGFEKVDETVPALWWTDAKERHHRRWKTKSGLIKEGVGTPADTKVSMMNKLGYSRIWDCGKIKLKWLSEPVVDTTSNCRV